MRLGILTHVEMVQVLVVVTVEMVPGTWVSVTGHSVVYVSTTSVVTGLVSYGQLVTDDGHLEMVLV